MRKQHRLGIYLTENEWDAWRFCISRNTEATPYARRHYPAHYTREFFPGNDGNGNSWSGFVCWYHYRIPNDRR